MATAHRQFKASSKEAVLEAAVEAVKSLGHEVEHVEQNMGVVAFRTSDGGKRMTASVQEIAGAYLVTVHGPGFPLGIPLVGFGRATKRTIGRAQEVFRAMDAALAA